MEKNNWYMEALENTLSEQCEEIDELKAELAYFESSEHKSAATMKMIDEVKKEITEAVENLRSAMIYVESQKQYA